MNCFGSRALISRPFHTCSSVKSGVTPGGLTSLLAAKLVFDIAEYDLRGDGKSLKVPYWSAPTIQL